MITINQISYKSDILWSLAIHYQWSIYQRANDHQWSIYQPAINRQLSIKKLLSMYEPAINHQLTNNYGAATIINRSLDHYYEPSANVGSQGDQGDRCNSLPRGH